MIAVGTAPAPAHPRLPAGAFGGAHLGRYAVAAWTEKGQHRLTRWQITAFQYVDARTFLPPTPGKGTQLIVSKLSCSLVGGKKRDCNSNGKAWEIEQEDFKFDPLLERAVIRFGARDRRIVWKGTGSHRPFHGTRARRSSKVDSGNLWADVQAEGVAGIARDAVVTGRMAGRDLAGVKMDESTLFLWFGSVAYGGACLVDQGGPCLD